MTTQNITAATPSTADDGPPLVARTRRRLLAATMVAAAAALIVGHALNVPATLATAAFLARVQANPSAFLAGGLVQASAAFLLIPSALAIMALVPARGSGWATARTALVGVGAAATGAGLVMITTMMAMLVDADPSVARRVYDLAGTSSVGGLPFLLAPAMSLGLLLLGVALLRARAVPRNMAILLIIGAVLAALAPGGGLAGALGHLPLAIALTALAVPLWSRTRSGAVDRS